MNVRAFVLLLPLLSVIGCDAPTAPAPAGTRVPQPPGPSTVVADAAADFSAAYQQASEKKDVEELMRLYCWDGVSAEMRETVRGNARDELLSTFERIEITPVADIPESSVEGGVTWKTNLKPAAEAKVTFKPGRPGDFLATEIVWHLGLKNGRYLIVLSVPQ